MAERALNAILTDINTQIKTVSFGGKITTRGLCYLQEKDGKTFPLENTDTKNGLKISWDDKYPLQTYHRILDVSKESDLAQGFGANAFRQRVYSMRLVGIGSKTKLSSAGYEDNQEFAKIISDALPNFINSNEYVEVGDHEVIKQAVYDTEFAGVDHQKKYSMEGVAFWIDYTLRISVCKTPSLTLSNETASSIQLDWTGDGSSYGIERSLSATGGFTQIATSSSLTYTDTGLSEATTYYYRVRLLLPKKSPYSRIDSTITLGYSYIQNNSSLAEDTSFKDLYFRSDGLKLYLSGNVFVSNVWEYNLGVAFDLSTISYASSTTSFTHRAFDISSDGKYLLSTRVGTQLTIYTISSAWNVSTRGNPLTSDSGTYAGNGIQFNLDGTKIYMGDSANQKVQEYTLSTPYDASTISAPYDLDVSVNTTEISNIRISEDGLTLYITNGTENTFQKYTLSVAWDISTATYTSTSPELTQSTNLKGIYNDSNNDFHVLGTGDIVDISKYNDY